MKDLNKDSLKQFLESKGHEVSEADGYLSFISEGMQYVVDYSEAPHIRLITGVSLEKSDVDEKLLTHFGNEMADLIPFVKYHYVFGTFSEFVIDAFEYSMDTFAESFDNYISYLGNAFRSTDEHYRKFSKLMESAKEDCSDIPVEMLYPGQTDTKKKQFS